MKTVKLKATVAHTDAPEKTWIEEWDYVEIDTGESPRQAGRAMIDAYNDLETDRYAGKARVRKLVSCEIVHTYATG